MKIIGLDLSLSTGLAIITDGQLDAFFLIKTVKDDRIFNVIEDFSFLEASFSIAESIMVHVDLEKPDFIYIEQTNGGRNRTTQKQLEFIHCLVLQNILFRNLALQVRYVDTSAWRSTLKVRLTKEDKINNKLVKQKQKRGKITPKHLAVRWANETYGLELKLKDNNEADAIAIATYGYNKEMKGNNTLPDVLEALR